MAYRDDIAALGADSLLIFDGLSLDDIGLLGYTATGMVTTDSAIAEDATNCVTSNGISSDRIVLDTNVNVNNANQARKAVAGWFEITEFSPHPVNIYGEGSNTTGFRMALGFGNATLVEVTGTGLPSGGLQVFGISLVPNRVYHLCAIFLGSAQGNELKFFIDGVKQLEAAPSDAQPDNTTLPTRTQGIFADPQVTVGLGEGVVLLQAATNGRYNHWAFWGDDADADLTDNEVRQELFEKGALPDFTVTAGTEAAMQTNLDTINTTLRPNEPLCIRVPANTGDTDFELTADGITFDPLASIHVQYTGTATLNWRNDRDSNATIFSTTNGGTITVQNETSLTISGLENPTEVRVYVAGTQTEIDGQENVTTGTFSTFTYEDSVDIAIASLDFENIFLTGVDTTSDIALQVTQFTDRVFENP